MRPPRRRHPWLPALATAVVVGLLAACGSGDYAPTKVPTPSTSSPTPGPSASAATCTNATQSYDPAATLDTSLVPQTILARGKLRVGVSADSYLLGARNPLTGTIEGFDIDIAKAVAKAIFNDENKIEFIVIPAADRQKDLNPTTSNGKTVAPLVDMVARAFSMTCARWAGTTGDATKPAVAFSAEYYRAGLKILVRSTSNITSFAGLAGKRVCAPSGSTSLDYVTGRTNVIAVAAPTHTACLVLFQQSKVDAIAGDDTVLAGLAAQDPYAVVPKMAALTTEPYGLGFSPSNRSLVSFTNRLLDQMKADGRWKSIYDKWFSGPLGPAPTPPPSVYGRP